MVSISQLLDGDQSGVNAHQGWKSSVLRRATILSSSKSVNRYSLINLRKLLEVHPLGGRPFCRPLSLIASLPSPNLVDVSKVHSVFVDEYDSEQLKIDWYGIDRLPTVEVIAIVFGLAWLPKHSSDTSYPPQGGMGCPVHRVLVSQPCGLCRSEVEIDVVPRKCRNSRVLPSVHTSETRARLPSTCLKNVASRCRRVLWIHSFGAKSWYLLYCWWLVKSPQRYRMKFSRAVKERCFLVTVCTVHYLHVQFESFSALHGQKTKIDNLVEER